MKAGGELCREGAVDQPVFRQAGESGEGFRTYADRIMRLPAGGCANMAMVQVGLVHYL